MKATVLENVSVTPSLVPFPDLKLLPQSVHFLWRGKRQMQIGFLSFFSSTENNSTRQRGVCVFSQGNTEVSLDLGLCAQATGDDQFQDSVCFYNTVPRILYTTR